MYLVIDIGATKTLVALFSKRGRVVRRIKFRTSHGSKTFLRDLSQTLSRFKKRRIKAVVVAAPGVVQKNCSIVFGNRNWSNFDILTPLKSLFDCPIYVGNDASIASLFESYNLPGKTIFLTFSTGLGGGISNSNEISSESKDFEPGHWHYTYDGKDKEWEDIASATAIESFYHVDRATDLRDKKILEDIAFRVSLGLDDIIKKYKPDRIVLGGPLGKIFKLYAKYLPKDYKVELVRPKRPLESVIYGGYLYAKQKEKA